jgi:hypothetical protein
VLLLSPLRGRDGRWRTVTREFPAGDTLDAYLPSTEDLARVVINGGVVPPDLYSSVVPQAGDEIWLYPTWAGPELWIPLVIGVAVSLISMTVSHFLFRPKPFLLPQQNSLTDTTEERTFSFEGIRTAIGPGASVPVVYGRHRIGGQLLAAAVDQAAVYIDEGVPTVPGVAVTAVGYGEPQNIVIITAPGNGFQTNQNITLEGLAGKPALNTTWTIRILEGDPDSFALLYSWGVNIETPYGGGGVARPASTGRRIVQATSSPPTLSLFLGLCEGPISAILTETIQINGQPIQNFPGVQVFTALGTADQPAFAQFGAARNTFSDGRVITPEGIAVTYTSNGPLYAFVLNLVWEQGLFYMNEKGEKESNTVHLEYRYAVAGTGNWSPVAVADVTGDRTAPVRIGLKQEGLPFAQYDIQIARGGATQTNEVRAKFEPTLESVTEYIPNQASYPYTAWLGLIALATDSLRGALPNITVEVLGRTVRVATLVPVETWSDNPSWCVMDALTNARYGRGVPDGDIDLNAFYLYGLNCDQIIDGEMRHRLNVVLDRETRAQQFFLETMGGSRGLLLKSYGLWTPRPTMTEPPVMLLSWTMVSNVTVTYLRDVDAVNVMEARFANEDADYEQDVLTWPTIEHWPADVHKASLDLRGITKPSRIMRALQYELNRRRYENVLLELDASAEALPLQLHDLFRFSHPQPGWGTSGRIQPLSTTTILYLDEPCTMQFGLQYVVYLRYENDVVVARSVLTEPGTTTRLTLTTPADATPPPYTTVWVFGTLATEANTRLFRVTALQRKSDTTVHLEAVIHNPSIYDDALATPLPVVTTLFNPLGPPPPIVTLIATELVRIQSSGASLRVVNLSWDVAQLTSGYAPYGGASILRRTIGASSQAGQVTAGTIDLGAIIDPNDPNVNYTPLAQVRGHVLDYDDATVITGSTYQYRVVPVSSLGVPNNTGAREVLIHITGASTAAYFPGTPRNLRLKGQLVGVTEWEGRDVHVEWDSVEPSPLFSDTFFVLDYVVQVWAPAQLYLLRATTVAISAPGKSATWTYTYEQNYEDQVRSGYNSARRDLEIWVWARTNTGLMSQVPAHISVINPPPDMSDIVPDVTGLFEAALINFNQWVEPRDLHHYEVYLDIMNPPVAIYQDVSVAFRKLFPADLIAGTQYWTYILPFDTFGPGIPSQIATFTPVALTADKLDSTPPSVPVGLVLTTGSTVAEDGTINTWVEAAWDPVNESDVAGYQLSFRFPPSLVPTGVFVDRGESRYRLQVPGGVEVFARVAAYDKTMNISAFTEEVSITTGTDTTPPGLPSNLTAIGGVQKVHLLWTPPADLDYDYGQVWSAPTNDLSLASPIGSGSFSAEHQGLGANDTRYYWVRAVDRSGNAGEFYPATPFAGVVGTAGQLDTTFISSLAAEKITSGTIFVLVNIGISNRIFLDGVREQIVIFDATRARVAMGSLGAGTTDWGLRVWDSLGRIMFDATDEGVTTVGIKTGAISASHVRTDTAVITVAAQIANALIDTAHVRELAANKIVTGTMQAIINVGVGGVPGLSTNLYLDGFNRNLVVFDDTNLTRIMLGHQGSNVYGLRIWNNLGQLMYDFTTGATTVGITPNAVTESVQHDAVGNLAVTSAETVVATITFPQLAAGDEVLLFGKVSGTVLGTGTLRVRLREDSAFGGEWDWVQCTAAIAIGQSVQAVYPVGTPMFNKAFVLTIQNTAGGDTVAAESRKLVGLRRKR